MKGTIAWWELPVPDLDAAAALYGPVFDWSFAPFGAGFTMITDSGG